MTDVHPMFSPEIRDSWARQGVNVRGDETPGRSAIFYHASKRPLDEGGLVDARLRSGSSSGGADNVNWFGTGDPARLRRSYGGHVYQVEPTGKFTDNADSTGELGGEYESEHPLRIISRVQFGGQP